MVASEENNHNLIKTEINKYSCRTFANYADIDLNKKSISSYK